MFRVGIGYDTHPLVAGRPLVLGGVLVPSERGAEGHSDADALTHAITDAVLGALAEGDIGAHFPDREPRWRGVESLKFLAHAVELAAGRGYRVVNVDANVLLEHPKLRPHIEAMREQLAATLAVDISSVSIKAKTGEGMDAVGEGRAVTAQAIILLQAAPQ